MPRCRDVADVAGPVCVCAHARPWFEFEADGVPFPQTRYIVLGTSSILKTQTDPPPKSSGRLAQGRSRLLSTTSKPSLLDPSQPETSAQAVVYVTIYKSKVGKRTKKNKEEENKTKSTSKTKNTRT